MYYYTAVTELAKIYNDEGLFKAIYRLWDSVVHRNMYITGGIGSSKENEGFTEDYDLPNVTAYCETCAVIGMVYWNHKMNLITTDAKYADIMELCIYNGILSGVSLNGEKFFYINPLETNGTHHREEWYGVSCCPTQISRFIPSIGDYIYAVSDNNIWVNLFISSSCLVEFDAEKKEETVVISQDSHYPWDGNITLKVVQTNCRRYSVNARFPGWCRSAKVVLNGFHIDYVVENGYIKIDRDWKTGDVIQLYFDMPVERIYSDNRVKENLGKVALKRGPIVYCIEQEDNVDYDNIQLEEDAVFKVIYNEKLLGGVVKIIANQGLGGFTAIPYYAWDNRKPGKMKLWIPYKSSASKQLNRNSLA